MAAQRTRGAPRAVLLDAMGTLITFEPPAPRLRAALRDRLGVDVGEAAAARAMRLEIAHYRAHLHSGGDAAGLAALRRASAEAMRPALDAAADAPGELLLEALLAALRFRAFPEVPGVLTALRARGTRLVVASNWDCSLGDRLEEVGLGGCFDGVVISAVEGVAKPDPRLFARALALAGVDPEETVHVGDSPEADVAGALAAGVAPVLVDRAGERPRVPDGVPVLDDLSELAALLFEGR